MNEKRQKNIYHRTSASDHLVDVSGHSFGAVQGKYTAYFGASSTMQAQSFVEAVLPLL
jgi:hypothetical protein